MMCRTHRSVTLVHKMFGVAVVALVVLVSNSQQLVLRNVNETIIKELQEPYRVLEVPNDMRLNDDINGTFRYQVTSQDDARLSTDVDKIVVPDDFGLNITQFLTKYGYSSESYSVTTEDGYILSLYRILHGRNKTIKENADKKSVVLLMHGLLGSAMDWVFLGPDKSLGLMLADEGYDVWLGNNRGTTLSRKHVKLNPDTDQEFWDFSFDKLGYYDVPAFIDYILNATSAEKLRYIGFSQGTTQFYAMAARRPEYLKKVEHATSFAPVVYANHMSSPLSKFILEHMNTLTKLINYFNINEFFPHTEFIADLGKTICAEGSPVQDVCVDVIFFIVGFDYAQLNRTFLPILIGNCPAGSSIQSILHYLQLQKRGDFRRYDYGTEKNMKLYNSTTPPIMDVSKIDIPIALFYAQNDFLSSTVDVERLANELPHVDKNELVSLKTFNHLDFMIAKDVNTLVFDQFVKYYDAFGAKKYSKGGCTTAHLSYALLPLIFIIKFFL